jgi:hypothetical protein
MARFLLGFSSLLAIVGGLMHASAFRKALAAFASSNLQAFFGNSSKALWLGDSSTLIILGAIFGLISIRPAAATGPVIVLLALIPAATAILIYVFVGAFFAGHLLMIIAAAALVAGFCVK